MSDCADRADVEIQRELDAALSRIQHIEPSQGSKYCKICEEDIPEARAALGYSICIECQEERERHGRF